MLEQKKASITTTTVEIKTLTVNDKQVTLAVFRQIPVAEIVSEETGTLNGVPWGWVNYHWKECLSGAHTHVIWLDGDALRRCTIPTSGPRFPAPDREDIDTLLRELIVTRELGGVRQYEADTVWPWGQVSLSFRERHYRLEPPAVDISRIRLYHAHRDQSVPNKYQTEFEALKQKYPRTADEIESELYGALEREDKARASWKQNVVDPLLALPQLFIAV